MRKTQKLLWWERFDLMRWGQPQLCGNGSSWIAQELALLLLSLHSEGLHRGRAAASAWVQIAHHSEQLPALRHSTFSNNYTVCGVLSSIFIDILKSGKTCNLSLSLIQLFKWCHFGKLSQRVISCLLLPCYFTLFAPLKTSFPILHIRKTAKNQKQTSKQN